MPLMRSAINWAPFVLPYGETRIGWAFKWRRTNRIPRTRLRHGHQLRRHSPDPDQIIEAARENAPHVIGLSILSGSHLPLVEEVLQKQRDAGLGHIPLIVGGIIPDEDAKRLLAMGVARVYTPKDFELNMIMSDIVTLADQRQSPPNKTHLW